MAKVIKYKFLSSGINHGTQDATSEEVLSDVTMGWNEVNEEIAKREAYNGEYTIEDDGKPEPAVPESDTATWDELAAAYSEGVQSA